MAVVQISKIQVRRGQKNIGTGLPQLASGEIGWAIDTRELFIGNGAVSEGAPAVGNTKVLTQYDDLFQLADDERDVKIVYLAKGISNHDLVDLKWIADKYQIPGDRYALFAMIRGDSSDGLPGIRGIGEKGAANIANQFSSLVDVMKAAREGDERLTTNIRKKLLESADYAAIAPKLVSCALDVAIPEMQIGIPKQPKSMKKIEELKNEYGLGASIDRIISALGWN